MSKPILARPIANAGSWLEELALLYAALARDAAFAEVQRQRDEPASLRAARAALREAEQAEASAEAALASCLSKLEALKASATKEPPPVPSPGLFLALAALLGIGALNTSGLIFGACGIAALLFFFLALSRFDKKQKTLAEHAAKLEKERAEEAEAQDAFDSARSKLEAVRLATAEAREVLRVEQHKPRRPVERPPVLAIFRTRLAMRKVVVAGYEVYVDTSGVVPASVVAVPGLSEQAEAQGTIVERIAALAHPGPLLTPRGGAPHEIGALVGEEADLRGLLDDWVASLSAIETRRLSVPLVPSSGYLAAAISDAAGKRLALDDAPGVALVDHGRSTAAFARLRELGDALQFLRQGGAAPLKDTYRSLVQLTTRYSEGRAGVMQTLQGEVMDILSRSHLLSMRHYCPSCNRVPAYLEHKLGVAFDEAHLVDQQSLLERCLHDGEIAARAKKNPQLLRELRDAHLRFEQISSDAAVASATLSPALKEQLAVYLDEYRARLRELVFGSRRPAVELGSASRLHLRPGTEEWECAACKTTWSDPAIRELGMVARVKDELLIPMWNHLWTEKDEFRKSEVFRTNEQMNRFSEKEGEKLLQIAESYKADLRGVRERMVVASGDAQSQRLSLEDALTGLVDLGLMAPERPSEVLARLDREGGSEVESAKRLAERNESMLVAEPRLQQQRRPVAEDPVQVYAQPTLVFDTRLRVSQLRLPALLRAGAAAPRVLAEGAAGEQS